MEAISALFASHGLLAVFLVVVVQQLGLPIPAMPIFLLAGAAAADDGVFAAKALTAAAFASTLADFVWYFAGRRLGRRALALLCRISISPDSCVRQSELSFAKRGVAALVIAKFIPGLSTLAPALAGALGMNAKTFAGFNLAGSALWAGGGIFGGLLFHRQIERALSYASDLGNAAVIVLGSLLILYLAWRAWRRWHAARDLARLPRVQPHELVELLAQGIAVVIVDVRAAVNGLQPSLDERIPGARRIELATIETVALHDWPTNAIAVTYCACPNDASAATAAEKLIKRGFDARVLHGGIDGWMAAGYVVEAAAVPS
jgi:membrane protein DedA with SNARE-associated domain/rhodanese-related sulfurtransferase